MKISRTKTSKEKLGFELYIKINFVIQDIDVVGYVNLTTKETGNVKYHTLELIWKYYKMRACSEV